MENEPSAVGQKKAGNGLINLFALSSSFQAMAKQIPTLYLTMFMTDYLRISPVAMGTAMLIAKTVDSVLALFVAVIIEKVPMRHGKYLGWLRLLTVTIFFGNCLQMLDTTAFISDPHARLVIVCVFYVTFHGSLNLHSAARASMIPRLAGADQEVRKKLTARQAQLRAATSIISSAVTLPAVELVQRITGSESAGYFLVAVIFSLCFVVCNACFIRGAAPFDPPDAPGVKRKSAPTLRQMVASLGNNRQMLVLFLAFTVSGIGVQVSSGVTTYFFRCTGIFSSYTLVLTCRSVAAFLSTLAAPAIAKRLGKKRALIASWLSRAAVMLFTYLFALTSDGSPNLPVVLIAQCLGNATTNLYSIYTTIYWLDCGEYGYYQTGIDNRTMAVTVMNWPNKISMALGGSLVGYGLAWAGYHAPTEGQAAYFGSMDRYMTLWQLIPMVTLVLSALIIIVGYKLTDEEAARCAGENAKREAAAKA